MSGNKERMSRKLKSEEKIRNLEGEEDVDETTRGLGC
jgi:hypothetical protein